MKTSVKILACMLAAAAIAIPIAASLDLFQHSIPSVSSVVISSICGPRVSPMSLPPATGTGNVLFGCDTLPVLTVRAGGGTVNVWLSNATPPVRLTLVPSPAVPCGGGIWIDPPSVTFTASQAGDYWYCLENVSSPTPQVDVHWYVY